MGLVPSERPVSESEGHSFLGGVDGPRVPLGSDVRSEVSFWYLRSYLTSRSQSEKCMDEKLTALHSFSSAPSLRAREPLHPFERTRERPSGERCLRGRSTGTRSIRSETRVSNSHLALLMVRLHKNVVKLRVENGVSSDRVQTCIELPLDHFLAHPYSQTAVVQEGSKLCEA